MKTGIRAIRMFATLFAISVIHLACPNDQDQPEPDPTPQIDFDTLVDIDGNSYQTVTIGTQTWLAENWRVTRLNDGTPIPLKDYDHWWPSDSPQMAYLKDDPGSVATSGILYNWHVIHTGLLAPPGWRVPTAEDWQILIDFAGGPNAAGAKLKEEGDVHWLPPNTGATNEYGFTAVPGYWRTASGHTLISSGELFFDREKAIYWTSTAGSDYDAVSQELRHNAITVVTDTMPKTHAMSVRLIKN